MKTYRSAFFLALAIACLSLASCEGSKNPLSDPTTAKPDVQLAGIWKMTIPSDPNGVGYVHMGRAGDKFPTGMIRAIIVGHYADGTISLEEPFELLMLSTSIGENRYLSVIDSFDENPQKNVEPEHKEWKPSLAKAYQLLKYQIRDDTLSIWMMDDDVQAKLIKSGKIKGAMERSGLLGSSSVFTDSTENLTALLANPENSNLFDNQPVFCLKRIQ